MNTLMIIPHSHYDAEVFLTKEEYLEIGYKVIFDVLNALKSDPDYKFTLDQSAYIEPFLISYPELKDDFMEMVNRGRLEIVGGMYVMSDLNIPSGESIIRQFELGKGYFQDVLGIDVKTGWAIDTFGHCLQMPQILDKCGFDSYVFSRVAQLEKSEFYWRGIDGTRILTHWMPYHYAMFCNSPGWLEGFRDFARKKYNMLKPYAATSIAAAPEGGDFTHPVRHDADFSRKMNQDGDRAFDTVIGTPKEFFKEVLLDKERLETIGDDFNPVFQGCYSARIRMKQRNRQLENNLYNAEVLNSISVYHGGFDFGNDIRDAWEPVLFNQVHDVLGGVQMDKVFKGAMRRYDNAAFSANRIMDNCLNTIIKNVNTDGEGIPVLIFNSLGWKRVDKASVDVAYDEDDVFDISIVDSSGRRAPLHLKVVERYSNGAIQQAQLDFIAEIPAMGYRIYRVLADKQIAKQQEIKKIKYYGMEELDEGVLENEFYRVRVDLWKGTIASIIHKETGQEYINQEFPFGNMLVKEEDNGDFWEIGTPLRAGANRPITRIQPLDKENSKTEMSYLRGGSCSIQENDLFSTFSFSQKLADYEFVTRVFLYSQLHRIEIETDLTNNVKNVRYRIVFPMAVENGKIVQEIPFGAVQRKPGEYPAMNWTDFSNSSKGLALINCGLPGNSVVEGNMMLSIMKCTGFVSYGDVGGFDSSNSSEGGHELGTPHHFRYALVPHGGQWDESLIHRQGQELNNPFIVRKMPIKSGKLPPLYSFIEVENTQAVLSSVRPWQRGFLIRIYEATGKPAKNAKLKLPAIPISVNETNMLGASMDARAPVEIEGKSLVFDLNPFEVRTFEVVTKTEA